MSDKEVDYDYAMKIGSYLVAAEKGDNEALCMLGQLYGSEDAGVLKNEAFSLGCYTLAADRGNALAKCILYGYTEPYIVAETGKFDGFPPLSAHEVYFMGSLYGETRFKLQFRNMKRKGYTVRYEILENEKIINKKMDVRKKYIPFNGEIGSVLIR